MEQCKLCEEGGEISSSGSSKQLKRQPFIVKLFMGTVGLAGIGLSIGSIPFILPGFRRICLPFVPASDAQLYSILNIIKTRKPTGSVIDLGSGDGRIVSR